MENEKNEMKLHTEAPNTTNKKIHFGESYESNRDSFSDGAYKQRPSLFQTFIQGLLLVLSFL